MNLNNQQVQPMNSQTHLDDAAVCDVCGRFGAYRLGDRLLCLGCYMGRGSCCPEFGKDDLWTSQWSQFSAHEEHPGHPQLLKKCLHADGAVTDGKRLARVV